MSKADELSALADRCEREEGSRDLDVAIAEAVGAPVGANEGHTYGNTLDYTTSLDAAVTLSDWCIAHLSEIGADGLPMCVLTDGTREAQGMCLNSPTSGVTALARALCAAALRARAALL